MVKMEIKKTDPKPRTKPAEVRLDELMDAAQQLFITKGFEATTISDIVRDAQVAKGTFYHYFPSKNEMLSALRERFTRHFIEEIQLAVDACPAEDSVARLRAWCDAGITAYFNGMALHDALYHDHHYHTRGNQDRDAVLDQILTILNHGSTFGAWQLENPRLTAILMYHGMHGAVDDAVVTDENDKTQLGHQLACEFLRLLGYHQP
ncbi:TetR family transcriptional regulator [Erwinia rhapontici]|uniref:TetR family transcriptional regulator n=2 Tax=Erwiniaceae TaxID=1903409 RepID=A0ABN6DL28_ERWRD|nr:TetR/AcrR family transcriptional regulator [Erwinia rhapontici]NNS09450.1 TetR/AcrR family transcriptional regulator [Erwinia sp. JH02]TDS99919.1 TetR family transcriptional regulator [Erwinia rhapontici]BCQ34488.1 TetR family transcriptional regulator [Erwinia rhapontici]BCQ39329.1 TetR family transcriptional regulator [Erwinia rhapontici]